MSVLIIAQEDDVHTRAVVREVEQLGRDVVTADLSHFPNRSSLNVRYSCCGHRTVMLDIQGRKHDLSEFGSVWWRRPQQAQISGEIGSEAHRQFAANECAEALAGVWYSLEAFWVNDPAKDQVAHRKVMQLRLAQQLGFDLPDTLITNDPAEAKHFIDSHGYRDVVYKAFSATEDMWRETRRFRPEELNLLDQVKYAPVIFQQYVEAQYDIRITLVGDEIFAAAIHSQETSYPTDFRMDMANAKITPVELPASVQERLRKYRRALGLEYGAVDMRLRPDGKYVFLEINPAGQWLFIEEATQQPIAAAMARLLVDNDAMK